MKVMMMLVLLLLRMKRIIVLFLLFVFSVKFVKLIDDEICSNTFEAIVSTLRAARKKNVLTFEGEFLLKGAHDDTDITLV